MNVRDQSIRNQTIIDCLDEIAIISESDVNGNITHVNDLFEKISGYARDELIGKNHSIINSGHHTDDFFKNMWSTIKNGLIWRGEILNKNKNGELYWVDSTVFAVHDMLGEISGFMSIRYDITEKVQMKEAELAQYRLKSIGESAAQTIHDIMNPLTIIQQSLRMIQKMLDANVPYDYKGLEKKVAMMSDASLRIENIVRSMQMFIHGSLEVKESNLVREIVATRDYLVEKIQLKSIQFSFHFSGDIEDFKVLGNGLQLQQVIINLVNNSIDAIEELDNRWIKIELSKNDKFIELSVIDSGLGIEPAIQNKIFDSMFTTKKLFKGTGLGLGICKKIVESFGGKIKINNDSPNTRFDINFPVLLKKR